LPFGLTHFIDDAYSTEPPSFMDKPAQPQVQQDPMLGQLMQTAQQQQIQALQTEAAGDTANLMARYGARLASGASVGTIPLGIGSH
jgi:hypothetical protein